MRKWSFDRAKSEGRLSPHILPYLPSFPLRFFLLLISVPSDLFSSNPEAESGTKIDGQRGIADDFVVAAAAGVLDGRIGCDAGGDVIPSVHIYSPIGRPVVPCGWSQRE